MKVLPLLPAPKKLAQGKDLISWSGAIKIFIPLEWRQLLTALDFEVELVESEIAADIALFVDLNIVQDGYQIGIDKRAEVRASSYSGAFYALTTLSQLNFNQMPRISVEDSPTYSWRGVHLDVSRHFFTVAEVKRFIKLIAEHKLNRLHLHLNDDQGWRVEVPNWPLLTSIGAWRSSTPIGHADNGYTSDGVRHGGFYTARDLGEIRDYATAHAVVIVPEIDLPGHAQAVIAAYPQLGNIDEKIEVWTDWGISEHVLNVSDAALEFAEEVVLYVAQLFPQHPFHIGGDECPVIEWQQSEAAQDVMRAHGFTNVHSLQSLYTGRLTRALQERGHQVLAWDEVLDNDLPDELTVMAWRGAEKGIEALSRGHDVVMAPMEYLYLDWANSSGAAEPIAQTRPPDATSWERVYSFSELLESIPPELAHRVLGAQAQLWSEYIPSESHLDYMAFPRLCAFSEVVWGSAQEVELFQLRLEGHLQGHKARNVNYREI
jgi:hexosaminidase